jgi:hypothetical protein
MRASMAIFLDHQSAGLGFLAIEFTRPIARVVRRLKTVVVKAKSVLKPYPDELMDAHDVSPIVNSAKYDGPECIRPVADEEIPSGGQLSLL